MCRLYGRAVVDSAREQTLTRVDFYQIEGDETTFACRLIANVYRKGHRIYVHTASANHASRVDELLWTFRPDSFIPHSLQSDDLDAPVRIGFGELTDEPPPEQRDVLINLTGEIPGFFSGFDRVAEIVPMDKDKRQAARAHFGTYRDQGFEVQYHRVS